MSIEETKLTYGQIFKYEFHKAEGRTVDDDYEIAAKAVISEHERRTGGIKEKVVFPSNFPTPEVVARVMCNYIPGIQFNELSEPSRREWISAAALLVQFLRGYQ